jgi:hypothetical protein
MGSLPAMGADDKKDIITMMSQHNPACLLDLPLPSGKHKVNTQVTRQEANN